MDTEAARRARRKAIKRDLLEAYTDEEAVPPEWVELLMDIDEGAEQLRSDVAAETRRFVEEPDVRVALSRREAAARGIEERARQLNVKVRRLNVVAPIARFHRAAVRADELLRPLYRTPRASARSSS